jgi:hypothetical protein
MRWLLPVLYAGPDSVRALSFRNSSGANASRPQTQPEARPQAIARAQERYGRLVKAAGQAMSGDARAAMQDLVDHGSN